jgi:hypothetical protein
MATTMTPALWLSMTSEQHLAQAAQIISNPSPSLDLATTLTLAQLHTQTAIALRLPKEAER